MAKRVYFQLGDFETFRFSIEGVTYDYPNVKPLAERQNLAANIHEFIIETPDGKKVWLTTVGDEDQASPFGVQRGWYVAQVLSEKDAALWVKAFAGFTKPDGS